MRFSLQIKTSVTTVRRCVPKAVLTLLGHIDAHAKMDFNFLITRPPVKVFGIFPFQLLF